MIDLAPGLVNELLTFVRREGYEPGDRLPPIRALSEALKTGRNVVRDGLLEAQTLGLVRIEPRKGVFLQGKGIQATDGCCRALEKSLNQGDQNLFHLVDARLVIEAELASVAARTRRPEDLLPLRQSLERVLSAGEDRIAYISADEAFHLAVARVAGNQVLLAFLELLWRLIRPAKSQLLLSSQNRRVSDREHQELFQSIVAGDAVRARKTMDDHIRQGRALLLEFAHSLPGMAPFVVAGARARTNRRRNHQKPNVAEENAHEDSFNEPDYLGRGDCRFDQNG